MRTYLSCIAYSVETNEVVVNIFHPISLHHSLLDQLPCISKETKSLHDCSPEEFYTRE